MAFYLFFAITLIGVIITAIHYYLEKKDTGQTTVSRQTFFLLALFCSAVLYLPWIIYSWDPGTGSLGTDPENRGTDPEDRDPGGERGGGTGDQAH